MQNFKKSPRTRQPIDQPAGPVRKSKLQGQRSQPVMQPSKPVPTAPKVLPHRYKTQMCKNFDNGFRCPFGQGCNYAHGEKQLQKYLARAEQAQEQERLEAEDEENFSLASNYISLPEKEEAPAVQDMEKPDWVKKLINSQHEQSSEDDDHTEQLPSVSLPATYAANEQIRNYSDTVNDFCPQVGVADHEVSTQLSAISEEPRQDEEDMVERVLINVNQQHQSSSQEQLSGSNVIDAAVDQTNKNKIHLKQLDASLSYKPIYSAILEERQEQGKHFAIPEKSTSHKADKGWHNAIMGCTSESEEKKVQDDDYSFNFMALGEEYLPGKTLMTDQVRRLSCFEQICSSLPDIETAEKQSADKEQQAASSTYNRKLSDTTAEDSDLVDTNAEEEVNNFSCVNQTTSALTGSFEHTSRFMEKYPEISELESTSSPVKIRARGGRKCRGRRQQVNMSMTNAVMTAISVGEC